MPSFIGESSSFKTCYPLVKMDWFFIIHQIEVLYQFWIHTELIRKLPRPIEYIFTTPSHHRVHHATNDDYIIVSDPPETLMPSIEPSYYPTSEPAKQPSNLPTNLPSGVPTSLPSGLPSGLPSSIPTAEPSNEPSTLPTIIPSANPTNFPTNVMSSTEVEDSGGSIVSSSQPGTVCT